MTQPWFPQGRMNILGRREPARRRKPLMSFGETGGIPSYDLDHDRISGIQLQKMRDIAGGEMNWGITLPARSEVEWKEFAKLAVLDSGTSREVVGMDLTATKHSQTGQTIWHISVWLKASTT